MTTAKSEVTQPQRALFALLLAFVVIASLAAAAFAQSAQADVFAATSLIASVSSVLALLLYVAATIRRPVEWVVWVALFILFFVFYEPWIERVLQMLHTIAPVLGSYPIVCQQGIASGWTFIRQLLPDSWPVTIGKTFLPIWILLAGLLLRWGIYRWSGAGLRRHARTYWLWITTYFCGLVMLTAVSPWHFWTLFLLSVACGLIIIAGITQLLTDAFHFVFSLFWALVRILNVVLRWVVFVAVWITRQLKRFFRRVRALYDKYVAKPIRRILQSIHNRIESWRKHVIKRTIDLDKTQDDDDDDDA